jgi:hypothetical protein
MEGTGVSTKSKELCHTFVARRPSCGPVIAFLAAFLETLVRMSAENPETTLNEVAWDTACGGPLTPVLDSGMTFYERLPPDVRECLQAIATGAVPQYVARCDYTIFDVLAAYISGVNADQAIVSALDVRQDSATTASDAIYDFLKGSTAVKNLHPPKPTLGKRGSRDGATQEEERATKDARKAEEKAVRAEAKVAKAEARAAKAEARAAKAEARAAEKARKAEEKARMAYAKWQRCPEVISALKQLELQRIEQKKQLEAFATHLSPRTGTGDPMDVQALIETIDKDKGMIPFDRMAEIGDDPALKSLALEVMASNTMLVRMMGPDTSLKDLDDHVKMCEGVMDNPHTAHVLALAAHAQAAFLSDERKRRARAAAAAAAEEEAS